jgi:hypothetical protein
MRGEAADENALILEGGLLLLPHKRECIID